VKTDSIGYTVVGEQPMVDGATSSLEIIDDQRGDEMALMQLMQDEKVVYYCVLLMCVPLQPFISDLRAAEVRPIDFNSIIQTRHSAKLAVDTQGSTTDAVEQKHSVAKALRECQMGTLTSYTHLFVTHDNIVDATSTSAKYIFMQLPPAIDDMLMTKVKEEQKDSADVDEEKIDPVALETVQSAAIQTATTSQASSDDTPQRTHCLSRLQPGRIGKVQLMSSGKAFLCIGDVRYELRTALPVDCRQVCLYCYYYYCRFTFYRKS
jgi:hypothetical protein